LPISKRNAVSAVLFALLSGLSLPEVANATTRGGCAAVASVSAAAPTACVVAAARVMAARPVFDPAQGAACIGATFRSGAGPAASFGPRAGMSRA
jgi:hypothetical protein